MCPQMLRKGSGESIPLGRGGQGRSVPCPLVSERGGPALLPAHLSWTSSASMFAFLLCSFYWF